MNDPYKINNNLIQADGWTVDIPENFPFILRKLFWTNDLMTRSPCAVLQTE